MSNREKNRSHTKHTLAESSRAKRADVVKRLQDAMNAIDREIAHSGYYSGSLSIAEVCRLSGIRDSTLQKPTHKTTTLPALKQWLESAKLGIPVTTKAKRRAAHETATSLRAMLNATRNEYHLAKLEIVELKNRISELERLVAASEAKVTSIDERRQRRSG